MSLKEKLILVDADGVILDWFYSFSRWMELHGHHIVKDDEYRLEVTFGITREEAKRYSSHFNESAHIGFVPPFRDAIKYIKKLHEEHGYVFHCITALSTDPYAGELRRQNIRNLFGKTAFEKVICVGCGADKDEVLAQYKDSGCAWIEDKYENSVAGLNAGLTPYLMKHRHNAMQHHDDIIKIDNWKHFYELTT